MVGNSSSVAITELPMLEIYLVMNTNVGQGIWSYAGASTTVSAQQEVVIQPKQHNSITG
jgi:hypothetical protein